MNRATVIAIAAALAALGVIGGLIVYSAVGKPRLEQAALRDAGFVVLPQARSLEPVALVDQDGRPAGLDRFRGRWSLVFFGYTHCPDICPVTMAQLGRVDVALREEGPESVYETFLGVLVSVDPERDTPDVLAPYVEAFSPRFLGLTGEVAAVEALAASVYVSFEKAPGADTAADYLVAHSGNLVIIDPNGDLHGYVKPPFEVDALLHGLTLLAKRG